MVINGGRICSDRIFLVIITITVIIMMVVIIPVITIMVVIIPVITIMAVMLAAIQAIVPVSTIVVPVNVTVMRIQMYTKICIRRKDRLSKSL